MVVRRHHLKRRPGSVGWIRLRLSRRDAELHAEPCVLRGYLCRNGYGRWTGQRSNCVRQLTVKPDQLSRLRESIQSDSHGESDDMILTNARASA